MTLRKNEVSKYQYGLSAPLHYSCFWLHNPISTSAGKRKHFTTLKFTTKKPVLVSSFHHWWTRQTSLFQFSSNSLMHHLFPSTLITYNQIQSANFRPQQLNQNHAEVSHMQNTLCPLSLAVEAQKRRFKSFAIKTPLIIGQGYAWAINICCAKCGGRLWEKATMM